MYTPTIWKDEVVEHPYRYKETQNTDGSIEHTPYPGEVMQEGTPQSASNFNHMENGILEALVMGSETARMIRTMLNTIDGLSGEKVQVTLTNSQEYPFNNSKKTVQIPTPRNNKKVVSAAGGAVGEISFSDKLLNGFKVQFGGSAKSVVLDLYVRGGM